MFIKIKMLLFISIFSWMISCQTKTITTTETVIKQPISNKKVVSPIVIGADQFDLYLHKLLGKKVGLVVNNTSMTSEGHLVDVLIKKGINIETIFAPEHGFRGTADAGESVANGRDKQTNTPIFSLHGKHKKPTKDHLQNIDIIVFDIQDVGARFYTYISTMTYVMEACAEEQIPFLVLDRPNPNGHYVDGPILQTEFSSFVGLHPIPVVHGMTVGEYAKMVNGENWLKNDIQVSLEVIPCQHYDHQRRYSLPIKPSPNLPNMRSIYLYPSLCFFEGTNCSVGRGTEQQFQVIGHPDFTEKSFSFTPISKLGAKYPKHKNQVCYGWDLTHLDIDLLQQKEQIDLNYILNAYQEFPNKEQFFIDNNFFEKLAGTDHLRQQIKSGWTENEIRATWKDDLTAFKKKRKLYLIYP